MMLAIAILAMASGSALDEKDVTETDLETVPPMYQVHDYATGWLAAL
jgi:hypothetical protein